MESEIYIYEIIDLIATDVVVVHLVLVQLLFVINDLILSYFF